MAKKVVFLMVLAAAAAGVGFAQDEEESEGKTRLFSAGAGLIGVNNRLFAKTEYAQERTQDDNLAAKEDYKYDKLSNSYNLNDIGGYLFFDATYAEVNLSIAAGKVAYVENSVQTLNATKFGIGVYGKYPFKVGKRGLTIAPMAGIQYDLTLAAKTQYGNAVANGDKDKRTGVLLYDGKDANGRPEYKDGSVSSFNTLAIKLGAQARYPLGERLYLNAQWLYGITLNSAYLKSVEDAQKDFYEADDEGSYKTSFFTHGSTFKIAAGFAF